jgi:NAD(P)-dependent dehydrogenase (short-subunit alcohol dehydrogenase family)
MSKFGAKTTAEQVTVGIDLTGKTAVVTGANSGVGAETARVLALRGAHVLMACRDLSRADRARRRILKESHGRVPEDRLELVRLDLSSLASVRTFAQEFVTQNRRLHLLINNAGVLHKQRTETQDGFEAHFGVNHLGHFLLTTLLLESLEASAPSRVICVSSDAMKLASLNATFFDLGWTQRKYNAWRAYGDSKLMNLMFARELDRRVAGSGIVVHAVHPGIIPTRLIRERSLSTLLLGLAMMPKMKTVAQGAATTLLAATAAEYGTQGGMYLADCQPTKGHRLSRDPAACRKLWEISEALVTEKGHLIDHSLLHGERPRAS